VAVVVGLWLPGCGSCGNASEALANIKDVVEAECDLSGSGIELVADVSDGREAEDGEVETEPNCPSGYSRIPAGRFWMGASSGDPWISPDEMPSHLVEIPDPFCLKRTEVTVGEWEETMGPKVFHAFASCGKTCPMGNLSWYETVAYCNRKSELEGLQPCYRMKGCVDDPPTICAEVSFIGTACPGYRLPTEAEWEYAARAGSTTSTYHGAIDGVHGMCEPSNAVLESIAWFCANSFASFSGAWPCSSMPDATCGPQPVGQLEPNAWGLFDVLGNVWEWVNDYYGSDYYCKGPDADTSGVGGYRLCESMPPFAPVLVAPIGPASGFERVSRGGCWDGEARAARLSSRGAMAPSTQSHAQGFRPARGVAGMLIK
jgi:formylglycine-generating enzyme required for sulfatase activity